MLSLRYTDYYLGEQLPAGHGAQAVSSKVTYQLQLQYEAATELTNRMVKTL